MKKPGNEETRKWRNEEMKKQENMHQIFHSRSDKLEISGVIKAKCQSQESDKEIRN